MTDNANSFECLLEGGGAEMRLRSLRRQFKAAGAQSREPFTTSELVLLGVAVFSAVLGVGVFGFH